MPETSPPSTPQTAEAINAPQTGKVNLPPQRPPTLKPVAPSLRKTPAQPPKLQRKANTDGKHHKYVGGVDTTANHLAAVRAGDLPDDFKALIAGRIQSRNHAIANADVHIFEDDQRLTGHFTILKVK